MNMIIDEETQQDFTPRRADQSTRRKSANLLVEEDLNKRLSAMVRDYKKNFERA